MIDEQEVHGDHPNRDGDQRGSEKDSRVRPAPPRGAVGGGRRWEDRSSQRAHLTEGGRSEYAPDGPTPKRECIAQARKRWPRLTTSVPPRRGGKSAHSTRHASS